MVQDEAGVPDAKSNDSLLALLRIIIPMVSQESIGVLFFYGIRQVVRTRIEAPAGSWEGGKKRTPQKVYICDE